MSSFHLVLAKSLEELFARFKTSPLCKNWVSPRCLSKSSYMHMHVWVALIHLDIEISL